MVKTTRMEIPQTEADNSPYTMFYVNGKSFQVQKDVEIEKAPQIVKDIYQESVALHRRGNKQDKKLVSHH